MTAWSLLARQCKAPDRGGCRILVQYCSLYASSTNRRRIRAEIDYHRSAIQTLPSAGEVGLTKNVRFKEGSNGRRGTECSP